MVAMSNVKVVLSGGPAHLPESLRRHEVTNLAEKVKIPFAAGYEHFVHNGAVREVDGQQLVVFEWCASTRVAE
jgi:hypothetical protein